MPETIHESLTDTDGAEVTIEDTAEVIKPVFSYARKLVDEAKIHITPEGIHYDVVDPANVAMLGLDVPAEAFDTFEAEETTIGLNLKETMGSLRAGRQRESDEITLSVENTRLNSVIHRDYDGVEMDLENSTRLIDPDAIRDEPDAFGVNLPAEATVPRKLFEDVIIQSDTYTDHLSVETVGSDLVFDGEGDTGDTTAVVPGVVENHEDDVRSLFSLDYFKNNAIKAFKAIDADELELEIGEEFPIKIEFTTELGGAEAEGYWYQAPRIQK